MTGDDCDEEAGRDVSWREGVSGNTLAADGSGLICPGRSPFNEGLGCSTGRVSPGGKGTEESIVGEDGGKAPVTAALWVRFPEEDAS